MRSVTVKDKNGNIILKVLHRKNGEYDMTIDPSFKKTGVTIDIRSNSGGKVLME